GCELGSRIAQRSGGSRGAAACNGNPRLPKLLVWEMSPPGITRLTPRKSAWRSNVQDETSLSISPALKQRAQRILVGLKSAGLSIVTAESCTAGMIAAVLSRAEGAGEILHGGFVTYTKALKTSALGVCRG